MRYMLSGPDMLNNGRMEDALMKKRWGRPLGNGKEADTLPLSRYPVIASKKIFRLKKEFPFKSHLKCRILLPVFFFCLYL
jgi:hypothetical protein